MYEKTVQPLSRPQAFAFALSVRQAHTELPDVGQRRQRENSPILCQFYTG